MLLGLFDVKIALSVTHDLDDTFIKCELSTSTTGTGKTDLRTECSA